MLNLADPYGASVDAIKHSIRKSKVDWVNIIANCCIVKNGHVTVKKTGNGTQVKH